MKKGSGLANQKPHSTENERTKTQIQGGSGGRRIGWLRATGPVRKASKSSGRRRRARVARKGVDRPQIVRVKSCPSEESDGV